MRNSSLMFTLKKFQIIPLDLKEKMLTRENDQVISVDSIQTENLNHF